MFKKIVKYLKVIQIDVFIYSMTSETIFEFQQLEYKIESEIISPKKKKFYIKIEGNIIHQSFLFKKLFLLRLINKSGPAIGECNTNREFKGKSIYPFVINHIAREEILENNKKEVFIIVNRDNISSIRGIEKAGFKLYAKIKANRFLFFHFNVKK